MCVISCLAVPAMSRSRWSKSAKSAGVPGVCQPPQGEGIHVYLFWTKEGEQYLTHTDGEVTAEQLCISAAKTAGESAQIATLLMCKYSHLLESCLVASLCNLHVSLQGSHLCFMFYLLSIIRTAVAGTAQTTSSDQMRAPILYFTTE